jgi:hypothetical protein
MYSVKSVTQKSFHKRIIETSFLKLKLNVLLGVISNTGLRITHWYQNMIHLKITKSSFADSIYLIINSNRTERMNDKN